MITLLRVLMSLAEVKALDSLGLMSGDWLADANRRG